MPSSCKEINETKTLTKHPLCAIGVSICREMAQKIHMDEKKQAGLVSLAKLHIWVACYAPRAIPSLLIFKQYNKVVHHRQ